MALNNALKTCPRCGQLADKVVTKVGCWHCDHCNFVWRDAFVQPLPACPRCNDGGGGRIGQARHRQSGELFRVCDECGAVWFDLQKLIYAPGFWEQDFEYFKKKGLGGWSNKDYTFVDS